MKKIGRMYIDFFNLYMCTSEENADILDRCEVMPIVE